MQLKQKKVGNKKMNYIFKEIGQEPMITIGCIDEEIVNNLLGGTFKIMPFPDMELFHKKYILLVNDTDEVESILDINLIVDDIVNIRGNIVITRFNNGELVHLDKKDISRIVTVLKDLSV